MRNFYYFQLNICRILYDIIEDMWRFFSFRFLESKTFRQKVLSDKRFIPFIESDSMKGMNLLSEIQTVLWKDDLFFSKNWNFSKSRGFLLFIVFNSTYKKNFTMLNSGTRSGFKKYVVILTETHPNNMKFRA